MKFWLLDIWVESEQKDDIRRPVVCMFGLTDKGKRVLLKDASVEPFFYTSANREKILRLCRKYADVMPKRIGQAVKNFNGKPRVLNRIVTFVPNPDVPIIRKMLEKTDEYEHRHGKKYDTFEADIYFFIVYMKDKGITPCAWHIVECKRVGDWHGYAQYRVKSIRKMKHQLEDPVKFLRRLPFDIECDNPKGGLPRRKDVIIVFTFRIEDKIIKLRKKDDEEDDGPLIKRAVKLFNKYDPDLIFGYNQNTFDWNKIIERCEMLRIDFGIARDGSSPYQAEYTNFNVWTIKGRANIDLMGWAFKLIKSDSHNQHDIHVHLANQKCFKKRQFLMVDGEKFDRDRISKYWHGKAVFKTVVFNGAEQDVGELTGKKLVLMHADDDIVATHDIGEYAMLFSFAYARWTFTPVDAIYDTSASVKIENRLMRAAKRRNEIIPNKPKTAKKRPKMKGAITLEPEPGLFHDVSILDFASMYPNIAIKYNISFDTVCVHPKKSELHRYHKIVHEDTGETFYFIKQEYYVGMLTEDLMEVVDAIAVAKKKFGKKYVEKYSGEIQAMKVIARAETPHGYLAYRKARWFSRESGESVLIKGRSYIRLSIKMIKSGGNNVIYGDTDSMFMEMLHSTSTEEAERECLKIIETMQRKLKAEIKFDGFYLKMFFTDAKKHYITLDEHGKVSFTGFETVRGDWCALARRFQKRLGELMIKTENVIYSKCYSKVVIRRTEDLKYPYEDFIIRKGLSKDPSEYPSKIAHVEVLKKEGMDILDESGKVAYVICKRGGKKLWQRARYWKRCTIQDLDIDYYIEKQVLAVALRILGYFGVTKHELKNRSQCVKGVL